MESIRTLNYVPYYAQFQDVARIEEYINGHRALLDDPFWKCSGAATAEDYAYWANRACGMVCVKTCIEAFGGEKHPLHYWIQRGLSIDAYLTEKRSDNSIVEKGWLHAGMARVLEEEGLKAKVKASTINQLVNDLRHGYLVIASVSYELGTTLPITHQGGHLVTVTAALQDGDEVRQLFIHNPSGRTRALRENAGIPLNRFQQAFSGRVIAVKKA